MVRDTAHLPCLPCRDVHWLQRPEHGPGDAPQRKGGGLRDRGGVHQHRQTVLQRGERTFFTSRASPWTTKTTFNIETATSLANIRASCTELVWNKDGCRNQLGLFLQAGVEHKIEIKHQSALQTLGRYFYFHVGADFGIEFVFLVPKMSW